LTVNFGQEIIPGAQELLAAGLMPAVQVGHAVITPVPP